MQNYGLLANGFLKMCLSGNFGEKFDLLSGIGQCLLDSLLFLSEIKSWQFKFLFLLGCVAAILLQLIRLVE